VIDVDLASRRGVFTMQQCDCRASAPLVAMAMLAVAVAAGRRRAPYS